MRIGRVFLAVALLLLGAGGGQGQQSLTPRQALLQAKGKNLELRRLIAQQCETLKMIEEITVQLDSAKAAVKRMENLSRLIHEEIEKIQKIKGERTSANKERRKP